MNERYDIVDIATDICAFGYATTKGFLTATYKISGVETFKSGLDTFNYERFLQRMDYLSYNHCKLPKSVLNEFLDTIRTNKQCQNYIYEFAEKLRTTPFELNAQIIARLSVEFIENKTLSYYEGTLLTNIHLFNDLDWNTIYDNLNKIFEDELYIQSNGFNPKRYTFKISNHQELITFKKLIQLGLIFQITDLDHSAQMGFKKEDEINYEDNCFFINEATFPFYKILKDVIKDNEEI